MLLVSAEAEVSGPPVVFIQRKDAIPKPHPSPRHTQTPAKKQETKAGGRVLKEREGGKWGEGEGKRKETGRERQTDGWTSQPAVPTGRSYTSCFSTLTPAQAMAELSATFAEKGETEERDGGQRAGTGGQEYMSFPMVRRALGPGICTSDL